MYPVINQCCRTSCYASFHNICNTCTHQVSTYTWPCIHVHLAMCLQAHACATFNSIDPSYHTSWRNWRQKIFRLSVPSLFIFRDDQPPLLVCPVTKLVPKIFHLSAPPILRRPLPTGPVLKLVTELKYPSFLSHSHLMMTANPSSRTLCRNGDEIAPPQCPLPLLSQDNRKHLSAPLWR